MSTNKPYKKRVAIIGAGVSGLRAASVLLRRKQFVEVKVFEATEQVGGRVCSSERVSLGLGTGLR